MFNHLLLKVTNTAMKVNLKTYSHRALREKEARRKEIQLKWRLSLRIRAQGRGQLLLQVKPPWTLPMTKKQLQPPKQASNQQRHHQLLYRPKGRHNRNLKWFIRPRDFRRENSFWRTGQTCSLNNGTSVVDGTSKMARKCMAVSNLKAS